jgi:hypothetical protein
MANAVLRFQAREPLAPERSLNLLLASASSVEEVRSLVAQASRQAKRGDVRYRNVKDFKADDVWFGHAAILPRPWDPADLEARTASHRTGLCPCLTFPDDVHGPA